MPLPAASVIAATDLVYDLRLADGSSDRFYAEVARFSDRVLARIEERAADALDGYTRHLRAVLCEPERSRGDQHYSSSTPQS